MPTKIERHIWDGGSGFNNRQELVGYCKEEPFEVLKELMFTHVIHVYRGLYMPIDRRYPNNVEGLVITKYTEGEQNGLKTIVTGYLKDLNLSQDLSPSTRNREQILEDLECCKKRFVCSSKEAQEYYEKLIEEIKDYLEQLY